jgi:hypothetical protein
LPGVAEKYSAGLHKELLSAEDAENAEFMAAFHHKAASLAGKQ